MLIKGGRILIFGLLAVYWAFFTVLSSSFRVILHFPQYPFVFKFGRLRSPRRWTFFPGRSYMSLILLDLMQRHSLFIGALVCRGASEDLYNTFESCKVLWLIWFGFFYAFRVYMVWSKDCRVLRDEVLLNPLLREKCKIL